jgi:NADH-quinone oxidoreductase subunit L
MSNLSAYLWLIPGLPLAASAITAFLGPRLLRRFSHWPCIVAAITSCVLSVFTLVALVRATQAEERPTEVVDEENMTTTERLGHFLFDLLPPEPVQDIRTLPPQEQQQARIRQIERVQHPQRVVTTYTWFQTGTVKIEGALRADALTAIMLVTVTFVGSWIAIYSVGYMHGDEGYARYFAEVALFIFSMTGLVMADNLLLLYAFWEGVGLCSYLLIGFWFTRPAAAAAARKAFLVTRLGDLGFLIGILMLWAGLQPRGLSYHALDWAHVLKAGRDHTFHGNMDVACLLLFCGAVGKSAQFPLHVWLPDAMEGPSPVSALIHAATMVTAGVYLVARCMPLFLAAPEVLVVVAVVGGFTALLAALIALTQNDLKRVLAYSTISQLGYMFLALGSATQKDLGSRAVVAAIFHLFTHAFFKALLFLAAGSVMHAMGNVIDMRRLGGLRRLLPTTHATFLCGALALAGFPLLSGFWSKDEILAVTWGGLQPGSPNAWIFALLLPAALLTAGLTAFYTFRAYFLTFWGPERVPPEAGEHAHESPPVMTVPLVVLAAGAVAIGVVVEPLSHWFSNFLTHTPFLTSLSHETDLLLMLLSSAIAIAGIAVAWWMYVRQPEAAGRTARSASVFYQLSLNKFHLDELYNFFFVQPLTGLAKFCRIIDLYVIDSLVDLLGQLPRLVGVVFRPIQNGLVQFYALAMVLGLAVFILAIVLDVKGLLLSFLR